MGGGGGFSPRGILRIKLKRIANNMSSGIPKGRFPVCVVFLDDFAKYSAHRPELCLCRPSWEI